MLRFQCFLGVILSLSFFGACNRLPEHFQSFSGIIHIEPAQSFLVNGHSIADGKLTGEFRTGDSGSLRMTLNLSGQSPLEINIPRDSQPDKDTGLFSWSPEESQTSWQVIGKDRIVRAGSRLGYRTYRPSTTYRVGKTSHIIYASRRYIRQHIVIYRRLEKIYFFDPQTRRRVAHVALLGPEFEDVDDEDRIESEEYEKESNNIAEPQRRALEDLYSTK